ncbi:amidohydrolase family protein [Microbacterium betulae]|uniref:Amidohydrolase family protein n=1 Tax=Microbacterium betulae TaxID=2981139 RepID=A0AA97FKR2_9MICO|nr:amidohydrolase family protein [Microbacterium sp. AB]WOF23257.1 amidohydrolase family protein [Microbacterium sp. AB]
MHNTNARAPRPGMPGHPDSLWLVGGHIVDVVAGTVLEGRNVELRGGRIVAVTPSPAPVGANVLDIGGRFVVPGLVSVHTHLTIVYPFEDTDLHESSGASALRALARAGDALHAGVTTVRCLDERNDADIVLRAAVAQGWADAPRIFAAGRAIGVTNGHGKGLGGINADGHDEFLKAARASLERGADHVKVFITGGIAHANESYSGAQMTPEEMRAAVRATREAGGYVVAHAGGGGAISEAIDNGIRHFEHGYDLDDAVIEKMARARAYLSPTLSVTSSPGWMRAHGFTEWQIELAARVGPVHLASARRAIARSVDPADLDGEGIRITVGTDYLPGEPHDGTSCHVREMEYLEQAGMAPESVLRAGTWEGARSIGAQALFGAIAEGSAADIVLTIEDPTRTVSALRTIDTVIQEGRIVRSALVGSTWGART